MPRIEHTIVYETSLFDQFLPAIARHLKREEADLRATELMAADFPYKGVYLAFEDGSSARFRHAFAVEQDGVVAVFTEHCGYHAWLRGSIERYTTG